MEPAVSKGKIVHLHLYSRSDFNLHRYVTVAIQRFGLQIPLRAIDREKTLEKKNETKQLV